MYNQFVNPTISINEKEYLLRKENDNLYTFEDSKSKNRLFLFEDGIIIKSKQKDHETIINLHNENEIRVISECGNAIFPLKDIEKSKNNDIFIYAYKVEENCINIKIRV